MGELGSLLKYNKAACELDGTIALNVRAHIEGVSSIIPIN